MEIFKQVHRLQHKINQFKTENKQVGFVPTMGALHEGHLALIKRAVQENDRVLCSIFVNPTQFNDATDLEKYPRTTHSDLMKLYDSGCTMVFLPTVEEIYTAEMSDTPKIDFGELPNVLEGAYRPGHFDGVIQVVYRLLDIVQPHKLYMGQKDYQQQAIIGHLLRALASDIELVTCSTVRAEDGLALSSRNTRLTAAERSIAPHIYATLQTIAEGVNHKTIQELEAAATKSLEDKAFKVDYFSIVDGQTLQPIETFDSSETVVACTAAYLGDIRLIDNIILK